MRPLSAATVAPLLEARTLHMKSDNKLTDRDYLKYEQYHDSHNLRTRISLHEKYSANPTRWHTWVFDQFDLPSTATVLEVGCGPGSLWVQNLDRIPDGWQLTLSDLSPGMVREARYNLRNVGNIAYLSFDIQRPPLLPSAFDAIIANHMLYHLPDLDQALAAIENLLKPGGVLYAATNGRTHLQELASFVSQARGDLAPQTDNVFQRNVKNFTIQTGGRQLSTHFPEIELRTYPDHLVVDDAEAIIHYVDSSSLFGLTAAGLARLKGLLQDEIRLHGAITIRKEAGLFIARKSGSF
jgi:SAM-dependent methyltransferase